MSLGMIYRISVIDVGGDRWLNAAGNLGIEYNGMENVLYFRSGIKPKEIKILYTIPLKDVELSGFEGKGINHEEERILLKLNENNGQTQRQVLLGMNKGDLNLLKTHIRVFNKVPFKNVLFTKNAEYYGGHKMYLAGGLFGKFESGHMMLTETHLLFTKYNRNPSKRIEIIIPLESVSIEGWDVLAESRRKQISAYGASADNIGVGSAFIHDSGKAHHLVVHYIDENGIPQQPIFGVSSLGGKAIRQWARELYKQIVMLKAHTLEVKGEGISQQSNTTGRTMGSHFHELTNDPMKTQSNNNAPKSNPIAIPSQPTSQNEEIHSAKIPADNTTQIPIKETGSSNDELSSNKLGSRISSQSITDGSTKIKNENDELLQILRLRLVKGEISKEEYLELRKTIES